MSKYIKVLERVLQEDFDAGEQVQFLITLTQRNPASMYDMNIVATGENNEHTSENYEISSLEEIPEALIDYLIELGKYVSSGWKVDDDEEI